MARRESTLFLCQTVIETVSTVVFAEERLGLTRVESVMLRGPGITQSRQTKAGLGVHVAPPSKALTPRSRTGQIMYWNCMKYVPHSTPKMTVLKNAPRKPSTVFLGDSLMSGVRPTVTPQMYAKISLQMTRDAGTKNQIIPSRMLFTTKWLNDVCERKSHSCKGYTHLDTTTISKDMCTQQNRPNCCLRYPRFSDNTKPTKPRIYSAKLMNLWFVANPVSWASENTTCCEADESGRQSQARNTTHTLK